MSSTIISKRMEGLYTQDRSKKDRVSLKNSGINKLYKDYLGEVGGAKAHELLHTHLKKDDKK